MKQLKTRPALLPSNPDAQGGPFARNRAEGSAGRRRFGLLARLWYATRARWLGRRLRRVETELLQWTARQTPRGSEGATPLSREDLAAYESFCMERALLRAQIDWCRSLS